MSPKKESIFFNFLFWVLLIGAVLAYNFHQIGHFGPVSVHSWRQADSASFALRYYQDGMEFFSPKVHNMQGGQGEAVAEFPIMYYLAAALYHLFGPKPILLRLLNFALLALGLFALFRLLRRLLDSWAMALLLPMLILGVPVLIFYGYNFLPNSVGFGFTLLAAGAFFRYQRSGKMGHYYLMCGLALLGALIKISVLIPFLALAGTLFLEKLLPARQETMKTPGWGGFLASSLAVIGLVGFWYKWAADYNLAHQSSVLMTSIRPFWQMAKEDFDYSMLVITGPYRYWEIILSKYTLWLFMGLWILELALFRKIPRPAYLFLALLSLGVLSFLALFFSQLLVHGYYWIDVLALLVYVFALALWLMKTSMPRAFHHWAFGLALSAFVVFNLNFCRSMMERFYSAEYLSDINPGFFKQEELQAFYREHGISYDSTLVNVGPDLTPNLSLYYLNLRGWNRRLENNFKDANVIWQANNNVDYFVVVDTAYFQQEGLERTFSCPRLVFNESIYFFDIRGFRKEGE